MIDFTRIFIKDVPLDVIKDAPPEFFTSDNFLDHIHLYDRINERYYDYIAPDNVDPVFQERKVLLITAMSDKYMGIESQTGMSPADLLKLSAEMLGFCQGLNSPIEEKDETKESSFTGKSVDPVCFRKVTNELQKHLLANNSNSKAKYFDKYELESNEFNNPFLELHKVLNDIKTKSYVNESFEYKEGMAEYITGDGSLLQFGGASLIDTELESALWQDNSIVANLIEKLLEKYDCLRIDVQNIFLNSENSLDLIESVLFKYKKENDAN
jgi:hypothetical protein